jgi:hypothetical protein
MRQKPPDSTRVPNNRRCLQAALGLEVLSEVREHGIMRMRRRQHSWRSETVVSKVGQELLQRAWNATLHCAARLLTPEELTQCVLVDRDESALAALKPAHETRSRRTARLDALRAVPLMNELRNELGNVVA